MTEPKKYELLVQEVTVTPVSVTIDGAMTGEDGLTKSVQIRIDPADAAYLTERLTKK